MSEVLIVLGWILLGFLACMTLGAVIGFIVAMVKMSIVITYNLMGTDEEIVNEELFARKLQKLTDKYETKILAYADKVKEMNANEKKS